jgi:hypothetical protein
VVVQPATIPPMPLERPPILNISHWAAPGDRLSNTLHLLGLHGARIDMMGASNKLRGNLGCGSVRPPPHGPSIIGQLWDRGGWSSLVPPACPAQRRGEPWRRRKPATIPPVPLERLIVLSQTLSHSASSLWPRGTVEGSKVEGRPFPNTCR